MKSYMVLWVLFSALIFLQPVNAQVTVKEANAVVERYMQALKRGDIAAARNSMTQKELRSKNKIFNNKNYDKFLRKLYKNAHYEIINSEVINSDTALVDVAVIFKKDDSTKFRLWISEDNNQMHIIRESYLLP